MVIGLAAAVVILGLALLPIIAAHDHHKSDGTSQIYTYPAVYVWLVFGLVIGSIAMTFWVYESMGAAERMSLLGRLEIGSLLIVTLIFVFCFIYYKTFRIQADNSLVTIGWLWGIKSVSYKEIGKASLVEGRQSKDLTVYDKGNKMSFTVGGTLQDFPIFMESLKKHLPPDAVFTHRDADGKRSST